MPKTSLASAAPVWIAFVSLLLCGCGGSPNAVPPSGTGTAPARADKHDDHGHEGHDHEGHDHEASGKETAHSGWWCDEHGIPEAVCSMCSPKVASQFQKKGDWCEEHDRAKSQCFLCDPGLQAKFAKQYRAKYGKEPPSITVE